MKKIIVTVAACLVVLLTASLLTGFWTKGPGDKTIKVGFVYSEDESTPYTANFVRAQHALEEEFGDKVEILVRSNVLNRDSERPILELIRAGCKVLFINLDTDIPVMLAREYPDVTFCHISMLVGYVGAFANAEVISGYTAFLLGVRSVAPEATMRVRYTGSWGNYDAEKEATKKLIDEGCVVIAQHVNTSAPAIACEEATSAGKTVYHVGYHQSMLDVAPSCALISIRTNWIPYVTEAVTAILDGKVIEDEVPGNAHGRDMSAGFENGWVELLDLNTLIAADGTADRLDKTIDGLKKGRIKVFRGDYIGVNPRNPSDEIDLRNGYYENQYSSNPTFGYVLKDCILIED